MRPLLLLGALAACRATPSYDLPPDTATDAPWSSDSAPVHTDTGSLPVDDTPWIRPHWRDTLRFPAPCAIQRHESATEAAVLVDTVQSETGEPERIQHYEDGVLARVDTLAWDEQARLTQWTHTPSEGPATSWTYTYTGTSHLPVVARRSTEAGDATVRATSAGPRYTQLVRIEGDEHTLWSATWDAHDRPASVQLGDEDAPTAWQAEWRADPLPRVVTVESPGTADLRFEVHFGLESLTARRSEGDGHLLPWFQTVLQQGRVVSWLDDDSVWNVTTLDPGLATWTSTRIDLEGNLLSASNWRGLRPAPALKWRTGFEWPWTSDDLDHGGLPFGLPELSAPTDPGVQRIEVFRTEGQAAWSPITRHRYDLVGNPTQTVHLDPTGTVVAIDVHDYSCYAPFVSELPARFEDEPLP